jgi:hypothetical protein
MAEYVFYFLKNQSQELWRAEARRCGYSAGLKRSYQLGLLNGFNNKLTNSKQMRRNSNPQHLSQKSLTITKDPNIKDFLAKRYPRLISKRANTNRINSSVFTDGQAHGSNLTLNKGIERKNAQKGLLLK